MGDSLGGVNTEEEGSVFEPELDLIMIEKLYSQPLFLFL